MKKPVVVVQQQTRLQQLTKKSENAIGLVNQTINTLSNINEEIDKEVEVLAQEQKKLQEDSAELSKTKAQNAKIISNFTKLIEG